MKSEMTIKEKLSHSYRYAPVMERIWRQSYRSVSDCWIWTGKITKNRYGIIGVDNRRKTVHRVSWEHFHGSIPKDLCVLHKCIGTPSCWNPDHLYLGDNDQNIQDKMDQGRHIPCPGSKNGNAVLDEEKVVIIKRRLASDHCRSIAEEFGVGVATVRDIKLGRTWRHVRE
jgi:hypothetical protein